jgi:kynurenine formamidase
MRTTAAGVAGVLGGTMFAAGGPAAAGPARGRGDGGPRLVFLSHVNDPATTPVFPGDPAFTLETVATVPADGFYMQYVREGEHTGTHWGAPAHFQEGGLTADQLDPADLFLPAVVVDVRAQAADDADYGATVADVRRAMRGHGRIPRGSAVILWTGWADRWGTDDYANIDADGVVHQPGFLPETVEWLIESRVLDERGALGTDTFGPDRGIDGSFAASVMLYDRHRISLENLTNLGSMPTTGARVLVGGPRHRAGSGSTATIYGVLPG